MNIITFTAEEIELLLRCIAFSEHRLNKEELALSIEIADKLRNHLEYPDYYTDEPDVPDNCPRCGNKLADYEHNVFVCKCGWGIGW